MEAIKIKSKVNSEIELTVTPGHFSSDRFHVNYYIDMSSLKMRVTEVKKVAAAMAQQRPDAPPPMIAIFIFPPPFT